MSNKNKSDEQKTGVIGDSPPAKADISALIAGYESGQIAGWAGEALARYQWNMVKDDTAFKKFSTEGPKTTVGKMMLYDFTRKVLGKDTRNYNQLEGSCVAFGAKNANEYLQCIEIVKGDAEEFKEMFVPYFYGAGRVFIGGGQIRGDGSLGSWQALAVVKYGGIPSELSGLPKYGPGIAGSRDWGDKPGPSQKWVDIGKKHLIKSAAKINNWDEFTAAITNGYPCTIASSQGFTMEPDSRGFHRPSGTWHHQMTGIGVDNEHASPYAIILNSWSDVHGHLKDFKTGEPLPVGVLRVEKATVERMIAAGETFAYSQFDGFPTQDLSRDKWKMA